MAMTADDGKTVRPLRGLLLSVTVVAVVLLLLPLFWLRGGLFQESFGTASAAAAVQLSGGWRAIGDEDEFVLRSSELDDYLRSQETNGWEYTDQMGSGHLFARGDETQVIVCRLYSTRFRICPTLNRP